MAAASSDLTPQQAALHEVRARFEHGDIAYDAFRVAFEALLHTTDPAECARILAELPADPRTVLDALDRTAASPAAPPAPKLPRRRTFFTLMGEINRARRPWKMGQHTAAVALMGEIALDLTLAALPQRGTLRVRVLMGEVQITVPADVAVTVHAFTLMGAARALDETSEGIFAYAHEEDDRADTRHHLDIQVFALMGEVVVRHRAVPAVAASS